MLAGMEAEIRTQAAGSPRVRGRAERVFYQWFLPLGVLANLVLGLVILTGLGPHGWPEWLELATGAFCCLIAGWLAAAAWSRAYWSRTQARQVAVWRQIADAFFDWLEEAPLPVDALSRLKTSLDQVVAKADNKQP